MHIAFFQVLTNSAQGYLTFMDSDRKYLTHLNSTVFWYPGDVFWSPDGTKLAFDGAYAPYYFNDVFTFNISDPENEGIFSLTRETTYEDHFTGGWSPEGKMFAINRVKSTVVDNKLYITNGEIETICLGSIGCGTYPNGQFSVTGLDFLPDWKSVDHTPPVVQFSPLPVYSRSNDFHVSWSARDVGLAGLEWISVGWRINLGKWATVMPPIQDTSLRVSFGEPATRYDFQMSAADWAENITPLPQNPDYNVTTTTFSWLAGGQAFDSRGHPLSGLTARHQSPASQSCSNHRFGWNFYCMDG